MSPKLKRHPPSQNESLVNEGLPEDQGKTAEDSTTPESRPLRSRRSVKAAEPSDKSQSKESTSEESRPLRSRGSEGRSSTTEVDQIKSRANCSRPGPMCQKTRSEQQMQKHKNIDLGSARYVSINLSCNAPNTVRGNSRFDVDIFNMFLRPLFNNQLQNHLVTY